MIMFYIIFSNEYVTHKLTTYAYRYFFSNLTKKRKNELMQIKKSVLFEYLYYGIKCTVYITNFIIQLLTTRTCNFGHTRSDKPYKNCQNG